MRDVEIKIDANGSAKYVERFIANQYENDATCLVFDLPTGYIGKGYYQYAVFTLSNDKTIIRKIVDSKCIIDRDITNVAGLTLLQVIVKNIEGANDLSDGLVICSQPISCYIKPASYDMNNISNESVDKNIIVLLDEFDALLAEIRTIDGTMKNYKNELDKIIADVSDNTTDLAEVIEARGNFTTLGVRLNSKPYYFDSVANMKASNLKAGDYAITTGYYEHNDGGGADYLIRVKTDDVEDNCTIHLLKNGLVAELIAKDSVNVNQFGAKGDGVNDDTEAIQKAIDSGLKVVLNPKKKYMFSKTLNITKPIVLEGNYADLTYTGTGTGIYFNAENIESHKRDMGIVNNIMLHAPNGDKAIEWNYAIKTILRNIKIYDFKHYGIYFKTSGYESRFENIYLIGRKTNNTVGIYGNIGDMDFGALYGMNVQKFMEITETATNIELIHAWCANISIFEDEPAMSEETYKNWFNETVLFHFKQQANDYPLNFNYVYADTYNTVIKWESYHRFTTFKTLSLRGSNKLIESTDSFNPYSVYIGIDNLFANLSILSDESYYPTISKVNNFKVSKAIVRTIGNETVKIPVDRIKYFDEEVTGAYNRVLSGIIPLPFIYSEYNFGGDAKIGFPHHNIDNGNTTYQASLSGTYYVRLLLQSAPIQYGSKFCYVANDNSKM